MTQVTWDERNTSFATANCDKPKFDILGNKSLITKPKARMNEWLEIYRNFQGHQKITNPNAMFPNPFFRKLTKFNSYHGRKKYYEK